MEDKLLRTSRNYFYIDHGYSRKINLMTKKKKIFRRIKWRKLEEKLVHPFLRILESLQDRPEGENLGRFYSSLIDSKSSTRWNQGQEEKSPSSFGATAYYQSIQPGSGDSVRKSLLVWKAANAQLTWFRWKLLNTAG